MAGVNYVRVLADVSDESGTNPSGQHEGWTTEGKHVYWQEDTGFTGRGWFKGPFSIDYGEFTSMAYGPLDNKTVEQIREEIQNSGSLDSSFNAWATNPQYTDTERSNWVSYVENATKDFGCVQMV